jgi:transcription factor-like protein
VSYLNALCIHQIYSLGSGNRQLYQNADRSRGILIGSLRGIGLLSSQWSTGDEESPEIDPRLHDDPVSLAREWHAWIKAEEGRRAAWAAFEYDCSLCTLTSRRGAVDLGELPRKLPCVESLWNAASPQAWFALRLRLSPASFSPNLFVVLKTSLAGKEMGPTLGSWAKRLCAQVLGRLLWDIKELEVVAMPNRLGLHSMLNPYKESKRSILSALDGLLTLTALPSSTADLITYK